MTVGIVDDTPPDGGWTTDHLELLPPDGRRREILDGVLIVPPALTSPHQIICARLMVALEVDCPESYVATAGVEVRINPRRSFVPDVLVVTEESAARLGSWHAPHAVLLAVEIVSPGSQSMDRILKPALYAQAGIPFYWRIEIEGGLVVHTYKIDPASEVYVETGQWTDVIDLAEPWPLRLPISQLTPRHLPVHQVFCPE